MPYRLVFWDNFHPFDPEQAHEGGNFARVEEAIEAAKASIDRELDHFLAEERRSSADPTPKSLFERFRWFGELPIVYDQSGKSVFDSWDYCRQRAEELFRKRGPAPS